VRTDTALFAEKNTALFKRPRYVIELAFDSANTILWYFTSHANTPLPVGGSNIIQGVIEGLSGTSQKLNPDLANAVIGNINFSLIDRASVVTEALGDELQLGRSTRRQRVRVYVGYEGLGWDDFTLVQTQLVTRIAYQEGAYQFVCADVQREMRKDLFELAKTTLAASLSADATTIDVVSTAAFAMVAHGFSYSDAPGSTVGYVKLQDEVIRYTGLTPTQFTGCTRGALNTRPVEHTVDLSAAADTRTPVEEYVFLEMPSVKLMYALLTGILHGQGGATLPSTWHLGIPTSYVRLSDFTDIGVDLWDPSNDVAGFNVRFEGLEKTDGKKFIEEELALLTGVFMPVYADGALGLKRMANILAGAAHIEHLDETNLVKVGELIHDFDSLRNVLQINWNFEVGRDDFTRINVLIDASSVSIHGEAEPLKLGFRGLHGSRHSSSILAQRFDSLRDRYTGPPLRINVEAVPSLNTLEVGDVVRLRPPNVRDFVANGPLDRSFEIQQIRMDWITGSLGLELFASSQAPSPIAATADPSVLTDDWYSSDGTNLSTVLTISGSNPAHVTGGGTLTGTESLNETGSIFYFTGGDLVIDPGVTVNIVNNVQLRIKGFFQNNGTINGKGNGHAGAASVGAASNPFHFNQGTNGIVGSTTAGGGLITRPDVFEGRDVASIAPASTSGIYTTVPAFALTWDGTVLSGLPGDLRGSSGSTGMPATFQSNRFLNTRSDDTFIAGGAGGASGAGLVIVSRGFAQGVAAKIDLSGNNGSQGGSQFSRSLAGSNTNLWVPVTLNAGGGAGGAPGGLLVVLDGASTSASGLTETGFVAVQGSTPITGTPRNSPNTSYASGESIYSYYVGSGDGFIFPRPSLSGSRGGSRVQYVPPEVGAVPDQPASTLSPPTNVGLQSGTAELLIQTDGTIVPRVKITWTPSVDSRTIAYEIQFKRSTDVNWSTAPIIFGQASNTHWIVGVSDGDLFDFRIRAAGAIREVSDWVTILEYLVIGKTEVPSDVLSASMSFIDPFLSWDTVDDRDLRGYIVRYHHGSNTNWVTANPAHVDGFISEARFDTGDIVGGLVTMLVKAVDTTGHESTNVASLEVDLRPASPTSFLISRQPDGTREFTWATTTLPADFEGVRVRYFLGTTNDWSVMTSLHNGVLKAAPFESNQLAAGVYTFAIKNVDRAGNESLSPTFITAVSLGDPRIAGSVEDLQEEPLWIDEKIDCHVN